MKIELKRIHMENFKIFKNQTIEFSILTNVFAQNYKGKSSIADAFNWVLFGKSSTGNSEGKQFHPRRYDENGVDIDFVDIVVELLLVVDGREIIIRKTQKQKWVRKRGSEEKTYEGDTNEYIWNEVPVSETEHKKKVADIIQEDVFRKITNPHAFTGMDQKEQRKFLLEKVANISDADVFESSEGFGELLHLSEQRTLEEVRAINKKALFEHKKEQTEIPVRIDEVSKSVVEVDYSEQEKALYDLKVQLKDLDDQIADSSKGYEEINKLKAEMANLNGKISDIEREEKSKLDANRREVKQKITDADNEFYSLHQKQSNLEKEIESKNTALSSDEKYLEKLKGDYSAEKDRSMSDTANICPVCGQGYPEEMKGKMVAAFEKDKEDNLIKINLTGKSVSDGIKKYKAEIEDLESQIVQIKNDKVTASGKKNRLTAELDNIPAEVSLETLESITEYRNCKNDLKITEGEINLINTSSADELKKSLLLKKQSIQEEIETAQKALNGKAVVADAKIRVQELKEKLKETTQKVADCERLEFLLEKFEKAKMDLLSERINQKFKLVQWKLWYQQKNGGFEPVCVCMVHGSAYGENTTSTTERLMAGLDIISTLQDIYDTKAPIFIDNKESYNDWNIPQMDCQMVLLSVSTDEELVVTNN